MRFTLKVFGVFFGLAFGPLLLLAGWVFLARPSKELGLPLLCLVIFLATAAALIGVSMVIKRSGPPLAELGLCRGKRRTWHLLWQIPLGILVPPIVQAAIMAAVNPGTKAKDNSLESLAMSGVVPDWALLLAVIGAVVFTPIVEELVFRGVLIHQLRDRFGPVMVVLISAALFTVMHLAVPVFPALFVSGLFLGWLRLWHGNIWAPIALHTCNNAIATAGVITALT